MLRWRWYCHTPVFAVCGNQEIKSTYLARESTTEGKNELKKRGLRSPNLADALNTIFFQDYETFRKSYSAPQAVETERRKKRPQIKS